MISFSEYIKEAPDYKAKLKAAENRKRGLQIDLVAAQRSLVQSKKAAARDPHDVDLADDVKNDEWRIDDIKDWIKEVNDEIADLEYELAVPSRFSKLDEASDNIADYGAGTVETPPKLSVEVICQFGHTMKLHTDGAPPFLAVSGSGASTGAGRSYIWWTCKKCENGKYPQTKNRVDVSRWLTWIKIF